MKRFLEGFLTFFPFVSIDAKLIRYYPMEIYKNDWKSIGNIFKHILRKKNNKL